MFNHVWHVSGVLTVLIFFFANNIQARSATVTSYQHLNGINVMADMSTHNKNNNLYNEPANEDISSSSTTTAPTNSGSSGIWKDFSLIYRIYKQCSNENLSVCLKVKLLAGLEKVLRTTKTLRLINGVQFVRGENDETNKITSNTILSEKDIEATLPSSSDAKEQVLNNLLIKKLAGFLREHTLQVKFPDLSAVNQISDNSIEARKKKDKKGGGAYIMIPLLLGGTFIPIAYGALAMLAGKALIVSKLALVLASIIGIKKLLSGGGGKDSHEVVVSSGGHSGWGRDIDLAYSGWKPAKDTPKIA